TSIFMLTDRNMSLTDTPISAASITMIQPRNRIGSGVTCEAGAFSDGQDLRSCPQRDMKLSAIPANPVWIGK
ncbi:MAG: hypothetical protein LUQ53_01385, partial [Methanothrix sp.]|nr:hypothetical protein [Methanothrix sp.]